MHEKWNLIVGDGADATTYTFHVNGQVLYLLNKNQLNGARQRLANFQLLGFTERRKPYSSEPIRVSDVKFTIDDAIAGSLVANLRPVFKIRNQVLAWSEPVRFVEPADYHPRHRAQN